MSVLETNSLTLAYSDTIIIESLDLKIPTGEITVVVGTLHIGYFDKASNPRPRTNVEDKLTIF